MKISVVLLLGLTLQGAIDSIETYCTETLRIPQNFDLGAHLDNQRLLKNYIQCLTGEGKCNPAVEKVKCTIISSLKNDCSNCDSRVKENAEKMIKFLIERRPADWAKLTVRYDPSGRITRKYRALMQKNKDAS